MAKALSVIVSAVILIAVSVVAIAIVLAIGLPALDRAKEALLISEARDIMQTIDNAVREVIFEGQGSQRVLQIVSGGGDYFVESATDSIKFKLTAISDVISPGTYKKEGNLIISAGTDVKAYEKDYLNDSSLVLYMKLNTANATNHTLDSTTYKNDGKLYKYPCNPATCNFTTGKIGNALSFDGVDDYVNVGHAPSLKMGTGPFTLEAWFKWNGGVPVSYHNIFRMGDAEGLVLRIVPGSPTIIQVYVAVTSISYSFSDTINWHHTALTRNSTGTLTLYLDNANVASGTATGDVNGTATTSCGGANIDMCVGARAGSNMEPFNGTIDEVRIYNRALSADEIRQSYYRGLKGRETGTNLVLENERLRFEVPKIGNSSNLTAVNTSTLIDIITVKETGLNITPADSAVRIENDAGSMAGSGYTELTKTGELLREASIKAFVNSTAAGVAYEVFYTLRSNADFILQEIKNIVYS